MKKYIVLLLAFCVTPLILVGQSLDSLLQMAAKNNLELKALHKTYEAALTKGEQVNHLPNPTINAGVFVLPPETRLGPQWVKVGVSQMFPWMGTLDAREDLMLTMAKSKFEQIMAVKLELFYKVKNAYYSLYEIENSQKIIAKNKDLLKALERLSLVKVEHGKGSMTDVMRVKLKVQELEQKLKVWENKRKKPVTMLNSLLNRPLDTPIVLIESLTEMAAMPYLQDSIMKEIAITHPIIKKIKIGKEVAEKNITINRLAAKPSFGVGLDYVMVTKRTDADPKGNGRDIVMPKASINVPLYRQQYVAKEEEERLNIAALNYQEEAMLQMYAAQIAQAFIDYDEAKLNYQLYQELRATSVATIELLQTYYSVTAGKFEELISLQMDLIQYDLNELKAIVKSYRAKATIELYIIE